MIKMNKLAKTIRILTVAPIMALFMLLSLYLKSSELFGRFANFGFAILFLTVFPILAYPLQPLIKKYKDKGRDGQRTLAMIFAVLGYIGGCFSALILRAPKSVWIIYLTYLLSGILIMLFNKLFHLKASGHACGVAGPLTLLACFGNILGYLGALILAAVWWASLKMKRHTNGQLVGGTVIPIVVLVVVVRVMAII